MKIMCVFNTRTITKYWKKWEKNLESPFALYRLWITKRNMIQNLSHRLSLILSPNFLSLFSIHAADNGRLKRISIGRA